MPLDAHRPAPWLTAAVAFSLLSFAHGAPRPVASAPRPIAATASSTLRAFGTRSPAQRQSVAAGRLDAALADLSRHLPLARPATMLADLHALNPAVRFRQSAASGAPLVLIDAVTRGDPQQLKAQLLALGLEHAAVYANDVGGWLPVAQIEAASQLSSLVAARAAMPHTRAGAVTSQGDFAQGSAQLRAGSTLTGAGITVGALSDSYDCYSVYGAPGSGVPAFGHNGYAQNGFTNTASQDQSTGDLPASVAVLEEADCLNYGAPLELPFGDEGRAILQSVYDVAPGSKLAFYTAENSEADFATGIGRLAAAGATIELDDVGYFDEPFFQDGIVAQAIDNVEAQGVAYFSAAGNDSNLSYENTTPVFATLSSTAPNSGEYLLNFDASARTTTTTLPVSIPALLPGGFVAVVLEWDQPYVTGAPSSGGASSSLDLCITGASGSDVIIDLDGNPVSCTGANASHVDPVQVLIIGNSAANTTSSAATTVNLMVGLANGTSAPGRIKIAVDDDGAGATINAFQTDSGTLQGHPGASGAMAIGAAFFADTPLCGTSPAQLEPYSSWGGTPILFDSSGARLASPQLRQKPDVVGPDGGNTTFFGWPLADFGITDGSSVAECKDNPSFPHFFGTSAATPHVAGLAALLRQANSSLTPTQLYDALRSTAAAMGGNAPNDQSGYGFVQAQAAYAALPAPDPAPTSTSSPGGSGGGGAIDLWSVLLLAALTARRVSRRLSCG